MAVNLFAQQEPEQSIAQPAVGRNLFSTPQAPIEDIQPLVPIADQQVPAQQVAPLAQELPGVVPAPEVLSPDLAVDPFPIDAESIEREKLMVLPEIGDAPEMNEFSTEAFLGSLAANITWKDKELAQILKNQFPEAEFTTSGADVLMELPSGKYWLNRPGISSQDVGKIATMGLGGFFTGLFKKAGARGLLAGAAGEMSAQAGFESAQKLMGGSFNTGEIAIAGGFGAGAEMLGPTYRWAKERFIPANVIDDANLESLIKNAQKKPTVKRASQAVDDIAIDSDILKAADEWGIDLSPDMYATNRDFKQVYRALADAPATTITSKDAQILSQLQTKFDDFITQHGGSLDKGEVSESILNQSIDLIGGLKAQSDELYKKIINKDVLRHVRPGEKLLAPIKKELEDSMEYMGSKGDISALSPMEQKVYNTLFKTTDGKPAKFGALDRLRQDIGEAAFQNSGVFADQSKSQLVKMYGLLNDSYDTLLSGMGRGADLAVAKKLIQERKTIEAGLKNIYGKELNKSLAPMLASGVTKAAKGDISAFNKVMNSIPTEFRQEAAVSALGDIVKGGTRTGGFKVDAFVSNMTRLMEQKTSYNQLMSNVPKEVKQKFEKLFIVAKGIKSSTDLKNVSGTAQANRVLTAMENKQTPLGSFMEKALVIGSGGLARPIISRMQKPQSGATEKAMSFFSSPAFQNSLTSYLKKGNMSDAERALSKTPAWSAFAKTLTMKSMEEVGRRGVLGWLLSQEGTSDIKPVGVPTPKY